MDLRHLFDLWPVIILLASSGGVGLALARCAVAEAVIRLAAWLHGCTPAVRNAKREEWLGLIQNMTPGERPAHAGSLLWSGLKQVPHRTSCIWKRRTATEYELAGLMFVYASVTAKLPSKWRCGWWIVALFFAPAWILRRGMRRYARKGDDDVKMKTYLRSRRFTETLSQLEESLDDRDVRRVVTRKLAITVSRWEPELPPARNVDGK